MIPEDTSSATPPSSHAPSPSTGTPQADTNKILAIVGYLVPLLFFVPLVMDSTKANPVSRFHASQQLNLLLLFVALQAIAIVPILGWLIAFFGWIAAFVLMVIGVLNAAGGKIKPLPIIGSYQLIK